jgi:glycosyltransferase involved in cell wall biosynthesis
MDTYKHKQLHVSLVIPAYNEERYLKAVLDSVAKQTVMPDEVIVVDNNSTDGTVALAKSYPFVKLIAEKRQGVGYASHRGFLAAKNELIARIDADTVLGPSWVETAIQYLELHDNVAAITGKCYFYDFPFRRGFSAYHAFFQHYLQRLIAGTTILWASNMVIRKSVWDEIVASQPIPSIHEDADMSLKLEQADYSIKRLLSLGASVSLIRGQTSLAYIWEYCMVYPDTFASNGEIIRSYAIRLVSIVVFIGAIPLVFIRYAQRKFSRQETSDKSAEF